MNTGRSAGAVAASALNSRSASASPVANSADPVAVDAAADHPVSRQPPIALDGEAAPLFRVQPAAQKPLPGAPGRNVVEGQ
ncbi:MAG: hypothetical protein U1E38_09760 [Rhodospirillales bacterium]